MSSWVVPLLAAAPRCVRPSSGRMARWLAAVGSAIAERAPPPCTRWPFRGPRRPSGLGECPPVSRLSLPVSIVALGRCLGERGLILGAGRRWSPQPRSLPLLRRGGLRRENGGGRRGFAAVFVLRPRRGAARGCSSARNQLFFPHIAFRRLPGCSWLEQESRVPSRRIWLAVPFCSRCGRISTGAVLVGFALLAVYIRRSARSGARFPVLLGARLGRCVRPPELWQHARATTPRSQRTRPPRMGGRPLGRRSD